MPRLRLLALGWLVLTGATSTSCDRDEQPRLPPARTVDKRSLYGDPALVPTRAGERTRVELAWAGELEAAIRVLPAVANVRVHVGATDQHGPASITATVRATPAADLDTLRTAIEQTIAGIGSPQAAASATVLIEAEPAPPDPRASLSWPLAAALLGLGTSLGITFERLRRRRTKSRSSRS